MRTDARRVITSAFRSPDVLWSIAWIAGMTAIIVWDLLFLNTPAFHQLLGALVNTVFAGSIVVLLALLAGWISGAALFLMDRRGMNGPYLVVSFILNVIRSIPQIVGIMFGLFLLTMLIENELLVGTPAILFWMSAVIAMFTFLEISDLVRSRIAQFAAMDFYPAMLACGMSELRIINREILWRNSRAHIVHAMIGVFGTAVFLQCSVDYVISVGLSSDVSTQNFPLTLGGLLASMDSKQDILAIGTVFSDPLYVPQLLFRHLQGVSVVGVLIFTLVCVYQVGSGFVRRNRL
jgi:ABC-type methionine transport system permease subunit